VLPDPGNLTVGGETAQREGPPPDPRTPAIEEFLHSLDLPDHAQHYLKENFDRIVRTLGVVPPPSGTKRVLELGAYMQMTPALQCLLGYEHVRGAYFGPLGRVDTKIATVNGEEIFRCEFDHFDAERDRFPYDDGWFETVLACEIIEHLLLDPMHMLLEIHRVLEEEGTLVLTTPNISGYTAIGKLLTQDGNPQLYSMYPDPKAESRETEVPHVREYVPGEMWEMVEAAGFEVVSLFTERSGGFDPTPVISILETYGYPTNWRGEQMYCIARKRSGRPITRYPSFLYEAVR
jgi:SAM-dependent methyltransferase